MTVTPRSTRAESCDLIDSDCDGSLLDGGESDLDGDGFPTVPTTTQTAMATNGVDCDDTRASVNPDAECATSYDDDCDGDDNGRCGGCDDLYADADGDDYGNPSSSRLYCDRGHLQRDRQRRLRRRRLVRLPQP